MRLSRTRSLLREERVKNSRANRVKNSDTRARDITVKKYEACVLISQGNREEESHNSKSSIFSLSFPLHNLIAGGKDWRRYLSHSLSCVYLSWCSFSLFLIFCFSPVKPYLVPYLVNFVLYICISFSVMQISWTRRTKTKKSYTLQSI